MSKIIRLPKPQPICRTPGCGNLGVRSKWNKDGTPGWRNWCRKCHEDRTSAKHGLKNIKEVVAKNAGCASVSEYMDFKAREKGFKSHADFLDFKAREKGFKSHTDYENSKHPYLKYRKDYCENVDGRFGYVCTTTIVWDGQLDVDHIDGDPSNNIPDNLQTVCKCCHAYKTNQEKDWRTPGRKALGIKY